MLNKERHGLGRASRCPNGAWPHSPFARVDHEAPSGSLGLALVSTLAEAVGVAQGQSAGSISERVR